MSVKIKKVKSKKDLKDFIYYPYKKYVNNPFWVPPLLFDQKDILDRKKHPFYLTSEAEFFLAHRNGQVCGRIAAIENHVHNTYHKDKIGFFGFFECDETQKSAKALLRAASKWCSERGLRSIQGPMNPSTNYECALLVDGFDKEPVLMMPYTPPTYPGLLEAEGFTKVKDLLSYWITDKEPLPRKLDVITKRIMRQGKVTIRQISMKNLDEELERIFAVYNDAWSKNWGFIPMSREELEHFATSMKVVCDPRIIFVMEKEGDPVGFLFAMPDLNIIFKKIKGRLFPFGWYHLMRNKKRLNQIRVIAMGFRKSYQSQGYAAAIYKEIIVKGKEMGYKQADIGWVLEDNILMNRAAEMLGAKPYKRYRIYEKTL